MGGACKAYGGEERYMQGFGGGIASERDHFEDRCVDGRIKLDWIFKKWVVDMDWIDLAQDRDRWRAPVNVVINHQVP